MKLENVSKILRRKSLEVLNVKNDTEAGEYITSFELYCTKCDKESTVKVKDIREILRYKCKSCEDIKASRELFLSNTGMLSGSDRIKIPSDKSAIYYRTRLRKIWEYQVKIGVSKDFEEYERFEEWALSNGYKPWKEVMKIDNSPLSRFNCYFGSKCKDDVSKLEPISETDTYKNRVIYLREILGRADMVSVMYSEIKELLLELECSSYCMNSDIEKIVSNVRNNEKGNELIKELIDSIYIGEQSVKSNGARGRRKKNK